MLGNFCYSNPTKIYFGDNSLNYLNDELKNYGKVVMLIYGEGSIKKNGIYDKVIEILNKNNKTIVEDAGVMPNPTKEKLYEGAKIAKENKVDLILAVGGGSVIDYAKAVSVSAFCNSDPWEKYYLKMEDVDNKIIPVGCILTMAGTGSEMNGGAVITDPVSHLKIGHVFKDNVFPKFSILNPTFTFTVPKYQMIASIYDIMNHITEQYFSGQDDSTSDYIMEGLMRSLIRSSLIANENPLDYEARSNIMWIATRALNTFVGKGKPQDWNVHMIGQSIGGVTNATHGMTLSAISLAYYHYIMPYGLPQFVKFAKNVWNVDTTNKSDLEVASEGLNKMEKWMKKLGLVMNIHDLGVEESMFDSIVDGTFVSDSGYKKLTREDVYNILKLSMK